MHTLRILVGAIIACVSLDARAIDQNAGIQVTQLMKTKHTWNGAPIRLSLIHISEPTRH